MYMINDQRSVQSRPPQKSKEILKKLDVNIQEFHYLLQILKFENINKGDLNKGDKTYDKLEKILEKSLSELQDIFSNSNLKKYSKTKQFLVVIFQIINY